MDNKRRNFLKTTGALLTSSSIPMLSMFPTTASAVINPNPKKLVVILLQGGNDGVNTVIPLDAAENANYQALRPDIGLPPEFVVPYGTSPNNIDLGIHPAMQSLMPLKDKLALFPATHSGPFSNTSHFFQYDFFGSGLYVGANFIDDKGWIGRHLDRKYSATPDGIVAYDYTGGQFKITRGNTFVLGLTNPLNQNLGTSAAIGAQIWDEIKGLTNPIGSASQNKYAAEQSRLFDSVLPRLKTTVDFDRVSTIAYPKVSIGTNLKRTADMLLTMPELEVVHISHGGFDLHSKAVTPADTTSGRHANVLGALADSMSAFYNDLLATDPVLHDNVTVVVMTEFGRTAKQNNNLGTDHAQASTWMAFGSNVIGGIYGDYPGLGAADLEIGRYLRQTVDYRDILSEIMGPKFVGLTQADANALFSNYTGATTPLGFMV